MRERESQSVCVREREREHHLTSVGDLHKNTESVPALSFGLTTHLNPPLLPTAESSLVNSKTSAGERHNFCFTARIPASRTACTDNKS